MVSSNEDKRRWRKKYPEKVRAEKIRYYDKKMRENPEQVKAFELKFINMLRRLTRLLYPPSEKDVCSYCQTNKELEIHHLKYAYPIKKQDFEYLCRWCHNFKQHYQIPPPQKGEGG